MSKTQQPCRACHDRLTYSTSGLCWECRPAPQVQRMDATTIYIGGLGQLPVDTALQLAHAIADASAVTPEGGLEAEKPEPRPRPRTGDHTPGRAPIAAQVPSSRPRPSRHFSLVTHPVTQQQELEKGIR